MKLLLRKEVVTLPVSAKHSLRRENPLTGVKSFAVDRNKEAGGRFRPTAFRDWPLRRVSSSVTVDDSASPELKLLPMHRMVYNVGTEVRRATQPWKTPGYDDCFSNFHKSLSDCFERGIPHLLQVALRQLKRSITFDELLTLSLQDAATSMVHRHTLLRCGTWKCRVVCVKVRHVQ